MSYIVNPNELHLIADDLGEQGWIAGSVEQLQVEINRRLHAEAAMDAILAVKR